MKEIPILFSTLMVQAILDDRKSMTRRVVKPQPTGKALDSPLDGKWLSKKFGGLIIPRISDLPIESPYGQVGDRIWVRETWTKYYYSDENGYTHFDQPIIYYAADGTPDFRIVDGDGFEIEDQRIKWKPSIFMPKEACRIWLDNKGERIEKLQDITAEDALAEGVWVEPPSGISPSKPVDWDRWSDEKKDTYIEGQARAIYIARCHYADSLIKAFADLWDSINAKPKPIYQDKKIVAYESFPWEDIQETRYHRGKPWFIKGNPWVRAISFKQTVQ